MNIKILVVVYLLICLLLIAVIPYVRYTWKEFLVGAIPDTISKIKNSDKHFILKCGYWVLVPVLFIIFLSICFIITPFILPLIRKSYERTKQQREFEKLKKELVDN